MTRIVTMGSEFFVTAFKIQGIDGYVVSQADFNKMVDVVLADKSISIVFLQEDFYFANQDRLDKIKSTIPRPLFVEVPLDKKERQVDAIANLIKKTIGISLD
jgi:vacuolar-type H+-ATPase subunit F/Vma7